MSEIQYALKLGQDEITWLKHVYSYHARGERVSHRRLLIELRDSLSSGFEPIEMDGRLYSGGDRGRGLAELKLAGIYVVDSNSEELRDANKIIACVRDMIIENPDMARVSADMISSNVSLDIRRVSYIMGRIDRCGSFWSGAGGQVEAAGYEYFDINGERVLREYLGFDSIEKVINKLISDTSGICDDYSYEGDYLGPQGIIDDRIVVKKNKVFIIMQIDPGRPELEDVLQSFKDVCSSFGLEAVRADEIEHQDRITDVILKAIREYEYIIADISGEKPNVYYEIGYAHAYNKKPILYRREGSKIHFDLSLHNVPEYKNMKDLKSKLSSRLEAILGRVAID